MSTTAAASAPIATAAASATPWVERYRPQTLSDISHQAEVVATLQNAVETNRLPHLLFYGPPGTGKTSVALALCRQLWHPSQWRRRVLELNASDERGISVVRDKIKHFASLSVGSSSSSSTSFFKKTRAPQEEKEEKKYPNPPFKIIILDEADTVTPDAQAALRRVIESHSKITRFILICNYVTRIIEPLASRCAKFRFQPLPPQSMKQRLSSIAQAEDVRAEEEVMEEILRLCQGDMRRAVTTLQSAHALSPDQPIAKDSIAELSGLPPAHVLFSLLTKLQSFDQMQEAVMDICAEGYSAQSILSAFSRRIVEMEELDDGSKADLSIRVAEADKNLVDGADEFLQLMTVFSLAIRLFSKKPSP